ncbi:TetR/AcrR family transcriptional regulator [Spirosoma soli]|uniref:TetR/AcrR family transcriptional regulator n=1 Tax=Spirosoma soli TaxID=1770529 RepID=A0ABW5M7W7_9BACT
MPRDRAQTEQRLIEAVGQIISEEGYDQLGINRIANRAGINKILIYRYFGGLNGLLESYLERVRPNPVLPRLDIDRLRSAPLHEVFDACCEYLIAEYRQFRNDTQAQELLKAKLLGMDIPKNAFPIEQRRHLRLVIDQVGELLQTTLSPAYAAFLYSAITMLTLMSQQQKSLFGVDPTTEEGQNQIETVIRGIFRGAYLQIRERRSENSSGAYKAPITQTNNQSSDGLTKK